MQVQASTPVALARPRGTRAECGDVLVLCALVGVGAAPLAVRHNLSVGVAEAASDLRDWASLRGGCVVDLGSPPARLGALRAELPKEVALVAATRLAPSDLPLSGLAARAIDCGDPHRSGKGAARARHG